MHVTGPQSKSSYLARDVEGLLMEQGHELVLLAKGVSQLKNMAYLSECEFFPDIRPGVDCWVIWKLYVASKGSGKVGGTDWGLGLADAKYYI